MQRQLGWRLILSMVVALLAAMLSAVSAQAQSHHASARKMAAIQTQPAGSFVSLPQTRLMDTRKGLGASGPIFGAGTVRLQVAGIAPLPDAAVGAVVLNVTVTRPLGGGHITIYPNGPRRPTVSNINFRSGQTIANTVVVKVGSDGKVAFSNGSTGNVDLIADVLGYYRSGTASEAGAFASLDPQRLLDTRRGLGASGPVRAGTLHLQVAGRAGVPATGVSAVALNVTATAPGSGGHLVAHADGTVIPGTSGLNFGAGETSANLAIVQVGTNGRVALSVSTSTSVHLVADVAGYFVAGQPSAPGMFVPVTPERVVDTRRQGQGVAEETRDLTVVPNNRPYQAGDVLVANVTVIQPTAAGHLVLFPQDAVKPAVSIANFDKGQTLANLTMTPSSSTGRINASLHTDGWSHLALDVVGYYLPQPGRPTVTSVQALAGPSDGGTVVTITGTNLQEVNSVLFGMKPGANLKVVSATNLEVTSPPAAAGTIDVSVLNTFGASPATPGDRFSYYPSELGRAPSIASGDSFNCALTGAGRVRCWGLNDAGQLGNGTTVDSSVPVEVVGITDAVAISAGSDFACAVLKARAVKCWGGNQFGNLGDGTKSKRLTPVQAKGLSGVVGVSVGFGYMCAVDSAGFVYCLGSNSFATLGDAGRQDSSTPKRVLGVSDVVQVSAGENHACALSRTGAAWCWGEANHGQLGDGTAFSTSQIFRGPTPVANLTDAEAIAAANQYTCVVTRTHSVKCWGTAIRGEFGDGSEGSNEPHEISTLVDTGLIAPGYQHSCAGDIGGEVACTGFDFVGRGTYTATPGISNVVALDSGARNTCAVASGGAVKCWGENLNGQLGNGTIVADRAPVGVLGFG